MRTTKTLQEVYCQVLLCRGCNLSESCRSPIPLSQPVRSGGGTADGTYVVLGEAPGRMEDRQGKPFVGPAGQLLRANLKRVGLDPDLGYYLNVVSCWPKGSPSAESVKACRQNLYDQLAIANATNVLACGGVALSALLPRGRMEYCQGASIPAHGKLIMPVYHPAFILKSNTQREMGWRSQLAKFYMQVKYGERYMPAHCLYCNSAAKEATMVCYKHRQVFREDRTWKQAVVQDRLF